MVLRHVFYWFILVIIFPFLDCFERIKMADEDAVPFAQSQQTGILESKGESLGGKQVNTGDAGMGTEASQIVDVLGRDRVLLAGQSRLCWC